MLETLLPEWFHANDNGLPAYDQQPFVSVVL
jgi:hypothetical protein